MHSWPVCHLCIFIVKITWSHCIEVKWKFVVIIHCTASVFSKTTVHMIKLYLKVYCWFAVVEQTKCPKLKGRKFPISLPSISQLSITASRTSSDGATPTWLSINTCTFYSLNIQTELKTWQESPKDQNKSSCSLLNN